MSTVVITTTSEYDLPEFRACCDGCNAYGPPVEGKPLVRGSVLHDSAAFALAAAISGFARVNEPARTRTGRRARRGLVTCLYCPKCQVARELVAAPAAAQLAAT